MYYPVLRYSWVYTYVDKNVLNILINYQSIQNYILSLLITHPQNSVALSENMDHLKQVLQNTESDP